jgi:hypothetical protein
VTASDSFGVQGHVSRGFEAVREAFAENFSRRHELGGACCAFHGGEKVVDLWGGIRNEKTGEPWEQKTMVIVHSATKGLAAMTSPSPTRGAGSTMKKRYARIGRSSRSRARSELPSTSSWPTRRACLRSMSRSTEAPLRTSALSGGSAP